jgi:BirA family biotin operon repressor/biotin-[acetyl-CoA-carboxylase] ligase
MAELGAVASSAAIAVARMIEGHGVAGVGVKWPNDVVIGDDKVAGILANARRRPGEDAVELIIGAGVNHRMPGSSPSRHVTGIASHLAHPPCRSTLAGELIASLIHTIRGFEGGAGVALCAEWRRLDAYAGRYVRVRSADGDIDGIASGIDDAGALWLRADDGWRRLVSGSLWPTGSAP